MKALWIGRVEVLTESNELGDTNAFTNVVVRANSVADFRQHVSLVCKKYGWSLLGVEECYPASAMADIASEELFEMLEQAKDYPEACIFTTLYYYPSKPC